MFDNKRFNFTVLSVHKLNIAPSTRTVLEKPYSALAFRSYGKAEIRLNGQKIPLTRNCLAYIPKNTAYTIQTFENEEVLCIHFKEESDENFQLSVIASSDPKKFIDLFSELLRTWKSKPIGSVYSIDALFLRILENIEIQKNQTNSLDSHLQNAIDYMLSNFSFADLTIGDLAAKSGYCLSYFRRIFHARTGNSPQKYLFNLRVSYAKDLLQSGYYTVSEVSDKSGFSDPKYFHACYKKKFGHSPGKDIPKKYTPPRIQAQ